MLANFRKLGVLSMALSAAAFAEQNVEVTTQKMSVGTYATRCTAAEPGRSTSTWLEGESVVVDQADFVDGQLTRVIEGDDGKITLKIELLNLIPKRIKVASVFVDKDLKKSNARLNTVWGQDAMAATGLCETAEDVGSVTLQVTARPLRSAAK